MSPGSPASMKKPLKHAKVASGPGKGEHKRGKFARHFFIHITSEKLAAKKKLISMYGEMFSKYRTISWTDMLSELRGMY